MKIAAIGALALAAFAAPVRAQPATAASAPDAEARLFAVEIKTGPTWDAAKPPGEQALFREHSAHLKKLRDAGHIVMGARYADKGLLVFVARSAADVKASMDQDPSVGAGTFKYEIHGFNVFYSGTVRAPPRR